MNELSSVDSARREKSNPTEDFVMVCVEAPENGFVLRHGGTIRGKGWILAGADVEQIRVFLGGQFLCNASFGEFRPDIAERFPTYSQADQSGFTFMAQTPREAVEDAQDLTVVVRTVDGRETTRVVSIGELAETLSDPKGRVERESRSAVLWPIRLFLDKARIDDAGLLHVGGWALSRTPLTELRLYLGARALGAPEMGLLRPDVALNHPEYPDAEHSGFRLVQQLDGDVGQSLAVRVQAISQGGLKRQIIAPVTRHAQRKRVASLGGTQFCCDVARVDSRGAILASGWAVVEAGVAGIKIELDGAPLGEATIGLARPDVGNRFPRIPSARSAGFQFSHELGVALKGEHTLTFRMRDVSGAEQEIPLPVHTQAAGEDTAPVEDVQAQAIRFWLDQPSLSGEEARNPVRVALSISGWAVAPDGIAQVEVLIDDRSFEFASYGVRREDIAATFPEYPESLLCGFHSIVPVRAIGLGDHLVRIVITSKGGEIVEKHFSIRCEKSDSFTVRSKMNQAEIDQGLAVLDRRGHHFFDIRLRLDDLSEDGLQRAQETLASLRAQAYSNWRAALHLPAGSKSLRVVEQLASNAGCNASELLDGAGAPASREGAAASLLCFLRAGDRLGIDALLEFAIHAALNPGDDFLYSDDRRIDPTTGEDAPFFKPDWSPDLLLSFNYVGRAWCARASLLEAAGLSGSDFGALGAYAAVLRLTESAQSIGHLPRLLLHETDAGADGEPDHTALADEMRRRGCAAIVVPGRAKGTFRVARQVAARGRVSVIIPTIATRGLIETAIRGLRDNTAWPDIEIVCIDNIPPGQNLHWKNWLQENADKVVEVAEPFNWSRLNNLGAAEATGDYFLFLNDDIEIVHPDWLDVLVSHAQRPEIGVVGPQLLYPDGRVQHAGIFLTNQGFRHSFRFASRDEPGPYGLALSERNVLAVTGACMLIRREAFDRLGGFDERHSVVRNDSEFCLRAQRAGQLVLFTPYATLIHHELVSRARMADSFNEAQFHADWGVQLLKGDPYYNRNLVDDGDMWSPEPEPVAAVYAGHPVMARDRVSRILAVKLDHLGDFITAFPALRRLKARFPQAELHVLCAMSSLSLAKLEPCIDGAVGFDWFHERSAEGERAIDEAELLALKDRLSARRYDVAIDLRLLPDTRHVLQYTGATLLAGYDRDGQFPWLDVTLAWEGDMPRRGKSAHISDRATQLVEALSVACESDRPSLRTVSATEAQTYVKKLMSGGDAPAGFFSGTVVCVHPAVGNENRQWPEEHFAALIDLLVSDLEAKIVVIGAGREERVAARVLEKVTHDENVLSLVGKTRLQDLPYLLRACSLFVGNNSGPQHIAAALGVPTVGVHSAVVQASEWGPFGPNAVAVRRQVVCGPCYLPSASLCPRQLACLSGLRPLAVNEMCKRALGAA